MIMKDLLNKNEAIVEPFDSVHSAEKALLEKGYVAVKDGAKFKGIVTQADVIRAGHDLVIDCIMPRSPVREIDDVKDVFNKMKKASISICPVVNYRGDYLGSVTADQIEKELPKIAKRPPKVKIKKVLSVRDIENNKEACLNELSHKLKNPIQIIFSSLNLFKSTESKTEQAVLMESIYASTRQIDELVNRLFDEFFPTDHK